MALKQVYDPHSDTLIKMGRLRPAPNAAAPQLSSYLTDKGSPGVSGFSGAIPPLPEPPPVWDYTEAALESLQQSFLNENIGDCVVAAGYHFVGVATGNSGRLFIPESYQVVSDYSAISGYVPGLPSTDNGCRELDAMKFWMKNGFADGTMLSGYLSVNSAGQTDLKRALYLFENLYFGIELPDAWIDPGPSNNGFIWDVAGPSNPENGHSFIGAGYNLDGVVICTGGLMGTLTWAAITKYCTMSSYSEMYTMLSPDQLIRGTLKAPNDLSWADLVSDFNAMGGTLPATIQPTIGTRASAQIGTQQGFKLTASQVNLVAKLVALGLSAAAAYSVVRWVTRSGRRR